MECLHAWFWRPNEYCWCWSVDLFYRTESNGICGFSYLWRFYGLPVFCLGDLPQCSPRTTSLWQKIDHIGIYFLIAGTYTPVTLTILKDSSGLYLLAGVWSIAFLGMVYKIFLLGSSEIFLSSFIWLWVGWSFSILKMW